MKKSEAIRIVLSSIHTRDYALMRLILGATKSGVHVDKKKANSKKACRRSSRPKALREEE
jgi:hypothetical protein